jgi:diguanylate cyclase
MPDPTPDLDPSHELPPGTAEELSAQTAAQHAEFERTFGELEEAGKALEERAMKDVLTGLDNRRSFDEQMDRVRLAPQDASDVREGDVRHITLLSLDIDHFKEFNDTYGHEVGDKVLQAFAEYLKNSLPHRAQDVIARIGGEEFVIAYIGAPEEEIFRNKLRAVEESGATVYRLPDIPSLKIMMNGEEKEVRITASGGITCRTFGDPLGDAMKRADKALYESKLLGRNRVTSFATLPPDHHKRPAPAPPPELPVELL